MATTKNGILMSLGTVNMWGFSPAYDAQDVHQRIMKVEKESSSSNQDQEEETLEKDPLNILLACAGDIRHVLQTIAFRRRHASSNNKKKLRPLHLYVYEKSIEPLCRLFLFLEIIQDWELSLRTRCNLFLEIYGNSLVQERTSKYIEDKAKALIDFFHYENKSRLSALNTSGLLMDLSHLKMKARDEMVDNFKGWFQHNPFDIEKLRDHRLRHYYEVRYDHRNNLIDWDYTMNLKKIENASVIHIKQYREWRNSGIAFEFGDQSYTIPNRTMASYTEATKKNHGSVLCRGLWTDIIISPYISFGLDCPKPNQFAEQLFEIHNKGTGVEQNRHNTTEVCVYNLLSYLYEIETGEVYKMKKAHDIYSGIGSVEEIQEDKNSKITILLEEEQQAKLVKLHAKEKDARKRAQEIIKSFENIKIIPLNSSKLEDLYTKQRYTKHFDHIFLSSTLAHVIDTKEFTNLFKDHASLSVESSSFLLPLTKDQRICFVEKILSMISSLNFLHTNPFITSRTSSSTGTGTTMANTGIAKEDKKNKPIMEKEICQLDKTILHFKYTR